MDSPPTSFNVFTTRTNNSWWRINWWLNFLVATWPLPLQNVILTFFRFYFLQAYDQHLNMILSEVEETITTVEIDEEIFEELFKVRIRISFNFVPTIKSFFLLLKLLNKIPGLEQNNFLFSERNDHETKWPNTNSNWCNTCLSHASSVFSLSFSSAGKGQFLTGIF